MATGPPSSRRSPPTHADASTESSPDAWGDASTDTQGSAPTTAQTDAWTTAQTDVQWFTSAAPSTLAADLRAQTEPLAALAAVFAVCLGLALYAGVAADAPDEADRSLAEPTMERVDGALVDDGVIEPSSVEGADSLAPAGYEVRLSLRYDGTERVSGPVPPRDADRTSRPVSVRTGPGEYRPGRLVVEVWT